LPHRAPQSEVTSPERRAFILVLAAMSGLFLLAESPHFAEQPGYVLAARLAMSALLFSGPLLLARPLSARAVERVVYAMSAGVCLSFAAIAWGTGGTASPYFSFTPMLPLIVTIAVPDLPLGSLLAGVCVGGVGLTRVWVEGLPAPQLAFWTLAFSSPTVYGVVGAIFYRRQRARERRLVEERERAEEILAESERQRARAERLALVGRLAAGVAHDVSHPLAVASAGLAAIERQVAAASQVDEALAGRIDEVREALDRIGRTVEDVRSYSEAEETATEGCDLSVAAAEARAVLEERFRASVGVAGATRDLPPVHVVHGRLVQALVWIMADASGRGVRRLRLDARREGDEVVVEVQDDAVDVSRAPTDLPAATVREAGLALALAREDLLRAGFSVEGPGDELRLPARLRCRAAEAAPRDHARPAARVA
jgi:signal transduction histidine kinase